MEAKQKGEKIMDEMKHYKWSKIGQFKNFVYDTRKFTENAPSEMGKISVKAKVKLHGTNAGVVYTDQDQIYAQSRNNVTTGKDKHFGFTHFVETTLSLRPAGFNNKDHKACIVFGEWCGKGVQKGVALSELGKKVFAIFAIQCVTKDGGTHKIVEPSQIESFLGDEWLDQSNDIIVMDWYGPEVHFDPLDDKSCKEVFNMMCAEAENVEECCPFTDELFNIQGVGEGLVYYAFTGGHDLGEMFKVKGEKHSVTKVKVATPFDLERYENIKSLVDDLCPLARLEQGLNEIFPDGEIDNRRTGNYIKWLLNDIQDECQLEIEASGFTFFDLKKEIPKRAIAHMKSKGF